MYVPAARERVGLRNLPGIYLVLWVDSDAKEADLLRLDENQQRMQSGIPFHDIVPFRLDEPLDAA